MNDHSGRDRIASRYVRDHLDTLDRMRNFGIDVGEERNADHSAFASMIRSRTSKLSSFARDAMTKGNVPTRLQGSALQIRSFVERVRFVRFSNSAGSMVIPTSIATIGVAVASAGRNVSENFAWWYGGVFAGSLLLYYGNKLWEELDLFGSEFEGDDAGIPDIDALTDEDLLSIEPNSDISNVIQRVLNEAFKRGEKHADPYGENATDIESSEEAPVPYDYANGLPENFSDALSGFLNRLPWRVDQYPSDADDFSLGSDDSEILSPGGTSSIDRFVGQSEDAKNAIRDIKQQRYGTASKRLDDAIAVASKRTGISRAELYAYAYKESRFGRITQSQTSSATGTFQFLPRVFGVMRERYEKDYPILRRGPNDVHAAAMAAALLIKENKEGYSRRTGLRANTTDSYILYLMGQGNGTKFLENLRSHPNRRAAQDWSAQAKANRSIFYADRGQGRPLTYREMYALLHSQVGAVATAIETNGSSLGRSAAPPSTLSDSVAQPKPKPKAPDAFDPAQYVVGSTAPKAPIFDSMSALPTSTGPSPIMVADASKLWEEISNDDFVPDDSDLEDDEDENDLASDINEQALANSNFIRLPNGMIIQL